MSEMIFQNYGGNYQLKIDSAEDLANIARLRESHWAASSAPISGFHCDPTFLNFLDSDGNGRVRTDELKQAVEWLFQMLSDRSHLADCTDRLRLDAINVSHPGGRNLRAAAERILANLNAPDPEVITLSEVRDVRSILAGAASNGDGVVPPEALGNEECAEFVREVMAAVGSERDAGGDEGLTREILETFVAEAKAYLEWEEEGRIPDGEEASEIQPWGEQTAQSLKCVESLDEKIAEFFLQCDLVRLDPRTREHLDLSAKELEELEGSNASALRDRLRRLPLASPNPEGILDLEGEANPFYEKDLSELRDLVLKRALGESAGRLDRDCWRKVRELFAAHRKWIEGKKGARVEGLGREKLRACLDGPHVEKVLALIMADEAVARELQQIGDVEKLILFQKWMLEFVNSFVSFPRLYDPKRRSLFEMGTLIVDGRELTFCVKVEDRAAHKKQAEDCNMYILYAEISGMEEEKAVQFEVVAAVTSGDSIGLEIGKRGVFFTIDGREWDALVVDIVENPVSLREAAQAPFLKMGGFISKQIEKFGKSQQAKIEAAISTPTSSSSARDLLLAGSVGVAALGSSFAYITKALLGVKVLHVACVILGILTLIMGPSMAIGFFKLHRRDLTALLEASGWAINIRMRLTISISRLFTLRPPLPEKSCKERKDLTSDLAQEANSSAISWRRVGIAVAVGAFVELLIMLILRG